MALKNTFMIGVMLVSTLMTSLTWGQNHTPGTYFERTPPTAQNLPLATPGLFDYDAQIFAPLEFTNGKEKEPNTGFNFSVDRTYTSVPRATRVVGTGQRSSQGNEFYWGSRYELGWMGENESGWNVIYSRTNGTFFTNGQDLIVSNPMAVEAKFSQAEVNRIFRQALSAGGYFEPYMGLRYNAISDNTIEDTRRVNLFETSNPPAAPFEQIVFDNRFIQRVTNSAIGLQAGARYNVRRGRWRFTTDGTVATTYNQQRYFASDITQRFDPNNPPATLITESSFSDQSFVPILDGSFEMAYNVSRDLSLKFGVQATYMWDGVARANTQTTNLNGLSTFGTAGAFVPFDEDYIAAGFIFGVEWRR
jgi:hypothetical protein